MGNIENFDLIKKLKILIDKDLSFDRGMEESVKKVVHNYSLLIDQMIHVGVEIIGSDDHILLVKDLIKDKKYVESYNLLERGFYKLCSYNKTKIDLLEVEKPFDDQSIKKIMKL